MKTKWFVAIGPAFAIALVASAIALLSEGEDGKSSVALLPAPPRAETTDPARVPPDLGEDVDQGIRAPELPECVPVQDSRGTIRGCVKRAELEPESSDDVASKRTNGARHEVYDDQGQVVGYFVIGPVGFIEKELGDDPIALAEVVACADALATPPVTEQCTAVLVNAGVLTR